jgi:osmotically-inducible protein OsmY
MADRWDDRNRNEFRDDRASRDRDRGMAARAGDEVRSWFGDEDAARRRRVDEVRDERDERGWRGRERATYPGERTWERTREAARDWTDRDRDGRSGFAEWNDSDRPGERSRSYGWPGGSTARERDDYWTRERSFGDTSRYATADRYSTPSPTPDASSSWSTPQYGRQGTGYAGRGPRGYQRSDDRIRDEVCDRLTDDSRIDASDVEVQVKAGEVTLAGSVRTREEKRYSEDLVERITGVREVNNNLKVRPADEVLGTARSGASTLGLNETPPPQRSQK